MKGEIDITLRGTPYHFGYKLWPNGEVEICYGEVNSKPVGPSWLKILEIKWQELLRDRISRQLKEGRG